MLKRFELERRGMRVSTMRIGKVIREGRSKGIEIVWVVNNVEG